jgi:hypothetical protein
MNDILNLVVTHKDVLIAAAGVVWEIVVRLKPTAKDWSIVNAATNIVMMLKRIVDIIPNNKANGATH